MYSASHGLGVAGTAAAQTLVAKLATSSVVSQIMSSWMMSTVFSLFGSAVALAGHAPHAPAYGQVRHCQPRFG